MLLERDILQEEDWVWTEIKRRHLCKALLQWGHQWKAVSKDRQSNFLAPVANIIEKTGRTLAMEWRRDPTQ